MKSGNWKDAAELVGMAAIVASLVFVGLQMRQTQDIAVTDSGWNSVLAEIEARHAIDEFPEIWAKGNAGEELSPSEATIYSMLIKDLNSTQFHKYFGETRLDNKGGADAARQDMAGFLYENPGARKEWESLRDEFRRYREPHTSGEYSNAFEEAVRADIAVLEKTYDP